MDTVSMAHYNSSPVVTEEIKMEDLHTFDNIDGELNIINTSGGVNSEAAREPADIKMEMALESGQVEKSVEDLNSSLSNGNAGLKFENKDNNNVLPSEGIYENAAIDQNSNITCTESTKALMVTIGKNAQLINASSEKSLNSSKKLTNSSGIELNDSRISNRSVTNTSENEIVLMISDESTDSDTDEVDSNSSDSDVDIIEDQDEKILQKGELLFEEGQDSDSGTGRNSKSFDRTNESLHENSATIESESEDKSKKKLNANQTTLHKFLIPRRSLNQESSELKIGNNGSSMVPRISISHLIMNTCANCDKGYTTFGIKTKKCQDCGKRMKFTCFICEKLYNTHSGIYSHVVQFHRFSLNSFNEKIHSFIKTNCLKCKGIFGPAQSSCSKCNINLKFRCVACNEQCDTRPRIHMHVVQNHTEEFALEGGATSIEKTNDASKKSDSKQLTSGKRKVRFQLDKLDSDEDDEVDDSKNEATGKMLYPTPRYPAKRRSVGAKGVSFKITDNIPEPKPNVSNKRQHGNAKLDNSKSKTITEASSNNEDTINSKQQSTERRRSGRFSRNSSEANNVSEAVNNKGMPLKSSNSTSKVNGKRQVPIQNKSEVIINPPKNSKSTEQPINIRRRSSRIATDGKSNSQNEGISDDIISVSNTSVTKQNNNKRRRSKLTNDNSVTEDANVTIVDVHPIPIKYESTQQATDRRRSLRTMSSSSEASNHIESMPTRVHSKSNVPHVPSQQIATKRRSVNNTSVKSAANNHVENREMDITPAPKVLAPKSSVVQGKRRSLRSILNPIETKSPNGNTSLDISSASDIPATGKQAANRRRKPQSLNNVDSDNRSDISMDESNAKDSVSGLLNCSICKKSFADPKACKKHENYCAKEPHLFCDSCSYATKYVTNLKKHKAMMHSYSDTPEASTSGVLSDGSVDYGALYTIDSTCTDILNRMEAHCPKCKEDAKMKPNDSHCRKCRTKLKLSCVRCGKVFPDFLDTFNHLYKECTEKEYHCARCSFATVSLEAMQSHVRSEHRAAGKSINKQPFVFAAQPQAPVSDARANLKLGFKTRTQSSVKPAKERAESEADPTNESKLKKCPQCNVKVPSLVKHLMQCREVLRCPFCSYTGKVKQNLRKHMVKCHGTKSHTVKFQAMFIKEKIQVNNNRPDIEDMMRSYCGGCDELQASMPYTSQCTTCETILEHRCIKCQARFVQREQLRKHVWSHVKSPKYLRCAGCSKGFAFPENLRMHEKVCTADQHNTTV